MPTGSKSLVCRKCSIRLDSLAAFSQKVPEKMISRYSPAGSVILMDCSEADFQTIWKSYFDLNTDYRRFLTGIDPADTYLQSAVAYGSGIRILRQDLWEMIISFIISQQNNIRRIRKCIETICTHYGTKIDHINDVNTCSDSFYLFPTPEQLATSHMLLAVKGI